ncbi:hypothetical protein [Deinococcus aestuarii]|uniref:hypothetical protein n=1 Tax=Deinococcus aestuarii TaxID=2774531 RepID=UPI001C0B087C|nr:hypothetical protein [Deinococcus aestuarii]
MRDIWTLLISPDGVDLWAEQTAQRMSQAAPLTWRRARLIPLVLAVLVVISAQEGAAELFTIPDTAQDVMNRYNIPAEFAPLVALIALACLFWQGAQVYRRSVERVRMTGLEAA